jgi:hypothetical protein
MKTITTVLSLFIFCSISFPQDIEGSKDHPMFNRLSGFYITDYSAEDFATHQFYYLDKDDVVEGKKTSISYLSDNEVGALKIIRNFSNAIKKIGGQAFEEGENRVVLFVKK